MNEATIPTWFKVTAGLAIVWNLAGLASFATQMMAAPDAMTPEQQAFAAAAPGWFTLAFGAATIGGTLGAVLLFLRKGIALPVLLISLLGVVAQFGYVFGATDALASMGAQVLLPIAVIVISIALVWLAWSAKGQGWLS